MWLGGLLAATRTPQRSFPCDIPWNQLLIGIQSLTWICSFWTIPTLTVVGGRRDLFHQQGSFFTPIWNNVINNHYTESPSSRYGLAGANLEEVTGRSKQCQKRTVAGVPRQWRLELEFKVQRCSRLGPGGRAMGSRWPAF